MAAGRVLINGSCPFSLQSDKNNSHVLLGELGPCSATDKQTCLKTVVLLIDNKQNVSIASLIIMWKWLIHPEYYANQAFAHLLQTNSQHNPMFVHSEVKPILFNGAHSHESVCRVAVFVNGILGWVPHSVSASISQLLFREYFLVLCLSSWLSQLTKAEKKVIYKILVGIQTFKC